MKVLQVIETAYRCNIEEQDDPAVWITHAMKGAGAELAVLLSGNAVNYAVDGQRVAALSFGDKQQSQPPDIARDLSQLVDKGVEVYLVQDDAAQRGIEASDLLPGVTPLARAAVPGLFGKYDQIWQW